jgi:hypothetical protein
VLLLLPVLIIIVMNSPKGARTAYGIRVQPPVGVIAVSLAYEKIEKGTYIQQDEVLIKAIPVPAWTCP